MWDNITDDCHVTFNRDSLYAVGGLLAMESKGKLKPVYDIRDSLAKIDNSYKVVTDSITPSGDSIKTKRILIDRDPANSFFLDSLEHDIIKAIAWVEYAGSNDQRHCHEHRQGGVYYNPQYNDYWDDFVDSQGDTCPDSKTPCENTISSATGTMQITRRWWEAYFLNSPPRIDDTSYVRVKWDSLAWNWGICIRNGKFIHDVYMPNRFKPEQKKFPDSCSYSECDTVPKKKNKEDLKTYAYYTNETMMREILTDDDWDEIIGKDPPATEEAKYVYNVRKYTYQKPWE